MDFRKFVFLILFFCFSILPEKAPAQENKRLDSLWQVVYSYTGKDTVSLKKKRQQLSDMFGVAQYGELYAALRVTDSLAEVCRLLGDSSSYYEALYRNKASLYQPTYDYRKTFNYLNLYATAIKRLGLKNGYAYVDVGNQYYSYGLSDVSKAYYLKANEIFKEENNYAGQCTVLDNLALISSQKNDLDSCLFYYHKSAKIRREIMHDPFLEAYNYVQIANAYTKFGHLPETYEYLNRARNLYEQPAFEKYKDFETMNESRMICFRNMASFFVKQGNADSAVFYYNKTKAQVDKFHVVRQRQQMLNLGARIDLMTGKYDAAFEKLKESESVAKGRQDHYGLLDIYGLYIQYYEKTGDWKNASIIQGKRYRLSDSLSLVNNDDQMLVMNNALLQFDNETQIEKQKNTMLDQQNEMAAAEREKQILYLGLIGVTLLVLLVAVFLIQFRKKNRLIQKYNRDLESANQTKEKFLSVISHDLRSPFNTLIGMSNVMVTNLRNNRIDQLAANAEAINESSRKAYVLLDNLMQWVNIQKEKITVNKEIFSLVTLVDEVLMLFRNQALAHSVTIEKDIRAGAIRTDRNLLQVILRNLLSNAIRHIPVGGKVSIRIEEDGQDILLVIEDNGKGIDEQTLKTLFDTKEGMNIARKGSGLGLELVREFAEQLGGSIQAENIPGKGARFSIRLDGAALTSTGNTSASADSDKALELTAAEKNELAPLIDKMLQYEIFDTTELRNLLDDFGDPRNDSVAEWKRRMQHAVYHSDGKQFEWLIKLAKNGHGHF